SNNSRNRVFREEGKDLIIHPFDPGKVEDSSLIVYSPLRVYKNHIIVTNGDQTDTVYEGLVQGKKFAEALSTRTFEPDAPNYTPRISGMVTFEKNDFSYQMNILKCADENGISCDRFNFSYAALPGRGHFIHTYVTDGNPLPTFRGEPVCVGIPSDVASFAQNIWNALNP
ncbi:MAG TPA: inosine monophosphate cyclohydrolase, partial [Clostridiales bacterium]|nr:inosine monophosphate cyclohydrolase [Clostridiales bacterium]